MATLDGLRKHKLLTKELERKLPPLYSQEDADDPVVVVKWFGIGPAGAWTWYATEYSPVAPDGTPMLAFGWVVGHEAEMGYFSLAELEALSFAGGVPAVERDLHWTPCPLSKVRSGEIR